jgi:hypothetical protein
MDNDFIPSSEELDRYRALSDDATKSPEIRAAAGRVVEITEQFRKTDGLARRKGRSGEPQIKSSLEAAKASIKSDVEFLSAPAYRHDMSGGDLSPRTFGGPAGGGGMHPWTSLVTKALGEAKIRDRGTFSVAVPADALSTKAFPTDSVAGEDGDPKPYEMPRRAQFVAELLGRRSVDDGQISYIRQSSRTNAAAAVARHGVKPTSVYELERIEDRPRTIAHLSEPIALQDLEDNTALNLFIQQELVQGLRLGLDAQIVNGDGLVENMTGLMTAITEVEAFDTDAATSARKAITTLEERDVAPTAFVINPGDWEGIDLSVSAAAVDQSPIDRAARRLWSVPVTVSPALPAGFALLGDFSGARLAARSEARVDFATAGDRGDGTDLFEANETKARAELRAVLEVLSIPKFIRVDLVTP